MTDTFMINLSTIMLMAGLACIFMPHWPDHYDRSSQ